MTNKRGSAIAVLLIIGALFLIVMVGIIMALGSSVINWVMDTTVPELTALGVVGDFNASQSVELVISPVDTFIQNWTWLTGVLYILAVIGVFGLALLYRDVGDRWIIGLFFALMIILVIGCIILSNVYEAFYNGTDEIALILHEHILLSYLILYSPAIMSMIGFLAGVILFSGDGGRYG